MRMPKLLVQVSLDSCIELILGFGETSKNREPVVAASEDVFGKFAALKKDLNRAVRMKKCGKRSLRCSWR